MAPFDSFTAPSTVTMNQSLLMSNPDLASGWIQEPSGRGTLGIIQSCVITIFLCSWSILCLNVPIRTKSSWALMRAKLLWMIFTIFWPEVTLAVAVEQWESASQGVQSFVNLGYSNWTIRHAFFADMGGFVLQSPDFPPFPIDGQQLIYLIERKYLSYPDVDIEDIRDKNKADGFARAIMLVQIIWFSAQCIGRYLQHLAITTLELSTVAIIFCSMNTLYFWYHKPLDVGVPIVLRTETRIADILIKAGDRASEPYSQTPLDFLVAPPSRTNVIAPWRAGLAVVLHGVVFNNHPEMRPMQAFPNTRTMSPRNSSVGSSCYRAAVGFAYFGIHFSAWNFYFPSSTERILWRTSSIVFIGLFASYYLVFVLVLCFGHHVAKYIFPQNTKGVLDEANTLTRWIEGFPHWTQLLFLLPIFGSYSIARLYITVEGFLSFRQLPLSAYESVGWSNFLPHL